MSATATHSTEGRVRPGVGHYLITTAMLNTDLDGPPRSLRCNKAGKATIADTYGTTVEYDLTKGEVLTLEATQITAMDTNVELIAWT